MSFKKQYFKTKPFCKVTFTVPKQLAALRPCTWWATLTAGIKALHR